MRLRCLTLGVGFSCSSGPDGGLLSNPVVPFLEETVEVPMWVGSSSSLSGLSTVDFLPVFPGCSHPGLSWLPLASSHSGVLCDASWGPPLFSRSLRRSLASCLAALPFASLLLVSRPWMVLSWSHLMNFSSVSGRFVVVPSQLVGLEGFPCFAQLPSFSRLEAAFLRVLCFVLASSLRDEVTLAGRVCLSPQSERRLLLHLPGVW